MKETTTSLEEKVTLSLHLPYEQETKKTTIDYYYKKETPSFYPSVLSLDEGKPIIRCNSYVLGEGILGLCFTYSGLIMILDGLRGEDEQQVIHHERTHRQHPMMDEAEVREKTGTSDYRPNEMVSYTT